MKKSDSFITTDKNNERICLRKKRKKKSDQWLAFAQ